MPPRLPPPRSRDETRERVIFALDLTSVDEARSQVGELGGRLTHYKVGLELFVRGGLPLVREIAARPGHRVFLDLKLHDIPRTVAGATAAACDLGASLFTLHGPPSSVRAAAAARGERTEPRLLGVTVLTSLDAAECRQEHGLAEGRSVEDLVVERARALVAAGCDGVVASAREAAVLRAALPDALLVTPGIRRPGEAAGDQARVATPREATASGADYIVVGRPLRDASDRRAAAEGLVDDAWEGFRSRAG